MVGKSALYYIASDRPDQCREKCIEGINLFTKTYSRHTGTSHSISKRLDISSIKGISGLIDQGSPIRSGPDIQQTKGQILLEKHGQ